MDKKLVKKYWDEVNRRAWEDAMNKSGLKLIIPTLAVLFAAVGISGIFVAVGLIKYSIFEDNLIANTITGISQVVITVFLVAFFYDRMLHETPPKMYEELGGFIEIPFAIKCHPPYPKNKDDARWASIDIINTSRLPVEKCYIEINDVTDSKNNSVLDMPRNAKWSLAHGAENRTKELELFQTPKVCDLAVAVPEHNVMLLETWAGQQLNIVGKGIYNLQLTVHGLWKGQLVKKPFELVLEYKGGNVITVIEKGAKKWEAENPKPVAMKLKNYKRKSSQKEASS